MSEEQFLRKMLDDINKMKSNLERFIDMKYQQVYTIGGLTISKCKDQQVYKIGGLTVAKAND